MTPASNTPSEPEILDCLEIGGHDLMRVKAGYRCTRCYVFWVERPVTAPENAGVRSLDDRGDLESSFSKPTMVERDSGV